ncbi:hypothetical protein L3Q82_008621 [Scortum barcoo]|uniref:Uncharacterized protein n=1 Tax=Scortum barcoo TaxID=214431 RepID=A0ACB8XBG9_9TELE|nr:hypothetical protein L3Q82_008621 [Scortum barcoo]
MLAFGFGQSWVPWLDSTVKPLLKACDAAYRSGDKLAYSIARKELKKDIKLAKSSLQTTTTIVGLILDNDETPLQRGDPAPYSVVFKQQPCSEHQQDQGGHSGLQEGPGGQSTLLSSSTGEAVEHVNNIKFLGIHITSDLTWSMNTAHLVKKAQQRLFFLRKLKRAGLSPQLLTNFYRATIESILCLSATVWYGSCTAQDQKDLARVVKTAQRIVGSPLPDLELETCT